MFFSIFFFVVELSFFFRELVASGETAHADVILSLREGG